MGRLVPALASITALSVGSPAARAETPNHVSIDLAEELGILSTTHTTVTAAYARRLWSDRLYVEARVGLGTNGNLAIVEERAGVGLVFRSGERVEVLVGWRIGDTYLRGDLNAAPYAIHLLAVETVAAILVGVARDWRLRAVPIAPTLFWNRTYGGSIGLELGVDRAF